MRASRLVNLLLILQSRGGLTASELARELEVSVRTVHRDVEALSIAGVPIYADRGPHGGIRLVDGYRTRLTGMTGEEAEAMFLSGMPGPAAELGLGTVVAAARLKVLASLPAELRSRASRLVERFHLDAAGWFQETSPVPHLAAVAETVWEGRVIVVDYDRGRSTVTRELGPLGLVLKAGVWYLIALTDGQIRTYRVSRIQRVVPSETRVARPDGFDLAMYWTESSAAYERDSPRLTVVVRLPEDRMDQLSGVVGWPTLAAAERLAEPELAGWVRLRMQVTWPDEVPERMMAMGAGLEVLEPLDVRERVIANARLVLERYEPVAARVEPDGREMTADERSDPRR